LQNKNSAHKLRSTTLGNSVAVANNTGPMPDAPLLSAQKLTRYYHGRKVLHGIDLELRRGEVLGFLGPNGAGKSTTMNILSGNLAAHSGQVVICGHDLVRSPLLAKRHIGYLPEIPPLYIETTVDEYLIFCARLRGLSSSESKLALEKAKHDCELTEVGGRLIGNLSKGFRQRVGIAQALLHSPAVVILDEPTNGLDPNQIRAVRATINALAERHAVILSSHVLSEVQALCTRVAILHHGRIEFNETVEQQLDGMRVQLLNIDSEPIWERLDGVTNATALGGGNYRVVVDDYEKAADAVCNFAKQKGWKLRELRRDTSPLETLFVDLTCNDTSATP
jgi:ABC-2 type transport system ATP-binding protein